MLSFQEQRVVQNDWTVSWRNRFFQLSEKHRSLSLPKQKITVSELLDGTIRLVYQGRKLTWEELSERPGCRLARPARQSPASPSDKSTEEKEKHPYKPAADHPWRRSIRQ